MIAQLERELILEVVLFKSRIEVQEAPVIKSASFVSIKPRSAQHNAAPATMEIRLVDEGLVLFRYRKGSILGGIVPC